LKPNAYLNQPFFIASLVFNENVMLIASLALIARVSSARVLIFYITEEGETETYSITRTFYFFLAGILIGSYFMFFCENERHIFTIDVIRFTKLMTYLGCQDEAIVRRHTTLKRMSTITFANRLLLQGVRNQPKEEEEKTKGDELSDRQEEKVLQLTREEVLLIAMNMEKSSSPPSGKASTFLSDDTVKLEIIPSQNEEKKFKERTIISIMVLALIAEEFSFKTAYGEYFRF
jgi:hypothetical protein